MYRVWYRHYTMSSAVMERVTESELEDLIIALEEAQCDVINYYEEDL